MWNEIITGLTFGAFIYLLFLLGHYAGVLMLWLDQREPELTPEQEAMLSALAKQPR